MVLSESAVLEEVSMNVPPSSVPYRPKVTEMEPSHNTIALLWKVKCVADIHKRDTLYTRKHP